MVERHPEEPVLGEQVRAHRLRMSSTQEELAAASGIGVRTIRDIESGKIARPRPATIRHLAEALMLNGSERNHFYRVALRDGMDRRPKVANGVHDGAGANGLSRQSAPAQLPADIAGFTGRAAELGQLTAWLDAGNTSPATLVISTIAGTPGVGKTALAVHWAHRVASRFPDGQLYVNLRGYHPDRPPMSPAEAVPVFLDGLQVPPQRIPASLEAQIGLYRSLLAGRRVLVVLDNARDVAQVRPLLPGTAGCLVVVTSRNQLPGLVAVECAHPMTLDVLTRAESRLLLERRLGAGWLATGAQTAIDAIIDGCGRLPLALAMVAARVATMPDFPAAVLANELREAGTGLEARVGRDSATDIRGVFSWSYGAVGADAARIFRLLGLHAGPDITPAAAASLAGEPAARVRALLTELVRANLLTEPRPGRFTCHDLLHTYAIELGQTRDADPDRRAARRRLLDHYLHTAFAGAKLLHPHRQPMIALDPAPPGVRPEPLESLAGALAWFTRERAVLVGAVALAEATGFDTHAWQLAWSMADFLWRNGHGADWVCTQHAALAAAERLGDGHAQALAHRSLALSHIHAGRYDDAHDHLISALELFRRRGDPLGEASVHNNLGVLSDRQGRHREAYAHAQHAFAVYRREGDRAGQAMALIGLGWARAQLGDYQPAVDHCRQALALQEEIEDRSGQTDTWFSLGFTHRRFHQHQQAASCYRRAIALLRDQGDHYHEAEALADLGEAYHASRRYDEAREAWTRAVELLDRTGHPDAGRVRAQLRRLDQVRPPADLGAGAG